MPSANKKYLLYLLLCALATVGIIDRLLVLADRMDSVKSAPKILEVSRHQQLKSRDFIANDPSCRWLDKRLDLLENQLMSGMNARYGYQQKEYTARHKAWVCLKCGAEGPSVRDYAQCQFSH